MPIISTLVDIAVASMILVAITKILQSKLIDKEKMKQRQAEMKEKQKQMKELARQDDERSRQQMKQLQGEMLQASTEMMQGNLRYMIISLPLLLVFFGLLRTFYAAEQVALPFALPWFRSFQMFNPLSWVDFTMKNPLGWLAWYVYCSLAVSLVFGIVNKVRKKLVNAK